MLIWGVGYPIAFGNGPIMSSTTLSLYVTVVLALVAPAALAGQYSAEVETAASEIFHATMSPFCPGRTLTTCPSSQAAELKDEIRAKLAAGVSPDSIRAELYAEYGEMVRATPPKSGFGLLAWLVPGLAFLVGALVLMRRLGRMRTAAGTGAARPAEMDPESRQRVQDELARL